MTIIITELEPYDILSGRNGEAYNNIGNRRFRCIISMNLPAYQKIPTRYQKSSFIEDVLHTLQNGVGARFLKSRGHGYIEISKNEARNKVSHALRDMLSTLAQQQATEERMRKAMGLPPLSPHKKFVSNDIIPPKVYSDKNLKESNNNCKERPSSSREFPSKNKVTNVAQGFEGSSVGDVSQEWLSCFSDDFLIKSN